MVNAYTQCMCTHTCMQEKFHAGIYTQEQTCSSGTADCNRLSMNGTYSSSPSFPSLRCCIASLTRSTINCRCFWNFTCLSLPSRGSTPSLILVWRENGRNGKGEEVSNGGIKTKVCREEGTWRDGWLEG